MQISQISQISKSINKLITNERFHNFGDFSRNLWNAFAETQNFFYPNLQISSTMKWKNLTTNFLAAIVLVTFLSRIDVCDFSTFYNFLCLRLSPQKCTEVPQGQTHNTGGLIPSWNLRFHLISHKFI